MTEKEFHIALTECNPAQCFYCKIRSVCHTVEMAIGLRFGSISNWEFLTPDQKKAILKIKMEVKNDKAID